uniref:Uncharacterized protein n=1 Tax=Arundo donax TaxID=35708 RepID=A0A0A9B9R6_ARUDO
MAYTKIDKLVDKNLRTVICPGTCYPNSTTPVFSF